MGRGFGVRTSFAIQAIRASMETIVFPVDLTSTWGPFGKPKMVSNTADTSRVVLRGIRLLNKPYIVDGECVVSSHGDLPTARCTITLQGADYSWSFNCWIGDNGKMRVQQDKGYTNTDREWLIIRAQEIKDQGAYGRFTELCVPAAQAIENFGSSSTLALDAAVQEFEKFMDAAGA